jgi:hypothetical protein
MAAPSVTPVESGDPTQGPRDSIPWVLGLGAVVSVGLVVALAVAGGPDKGVVDAVREGDAQGVRGEGLASRLRVLRPELAAAAQKIIDAWEQDDEGLDEELGSGGVCDRVAEAMADVINERLPEVGLTEGGQDGDDHAFKIAYTDTEAYSIDISPYVYETGGGYSWRKREGVEVQPEDVSVDRVPREWLEDV